MSVWKRKKDIEERRERERERVGECELLFTHPHTLQVSYYVTQCF